MATNDDVLQNLRAKYRRNNNLDKIAAVIGDGAGNYVYPQYPGKIIVQVQTSNGLSTPRPVLPPAGRTIRLQAGANVLLEYDKDDQLRIAEPDTMAILSTGGNPIANVVQPTNTQRVSQTDVETLAVLPTQTASLSVIIRSWAVIVNGTVYEFPGTTIDLTSFVPSAGDMCYAVLFVKSDYTTTEVFASTPRSTADLPLDASDIQECLNSATSGSTPVYVIKLIGGQTEITINDILNDGIDLRQMVNTISGNTTYAPANAKYILQQPNATLTNAQAISALSTGYLKGTTTTGVITSQAVPIPIADGGTNATTANTALNNLLPTQTGNNGKALVTDGSNTSWTSVTPAGAALTRTSDTNVTLTLTGTPATALLQAVDIAVGWSGQLAVTRGGTGLATVAQGDLLYGSAADTLSALAKDANATRYLSNTGTSNNPAWAQVNLANGVTGTLVVTNGGTGLATVAQGDLLYGSAANTLSALAKNTTATRYLANTGTSNNPAWAQIDLTNGVTGTLPIGNGGTGQTTANDALNALLPSQGGNSGKYLKTDGTNSSWATVSAGSPGGADTNVQYNSSGSFAGDAQFSYNHTNQQVTIYNDTSTSAVVYPLIIETRPSGAASNGAGAGLEFLGKDSTTASQSMGLIYTDWTDATHATRTSEMVFSVYSTTTVKPALTLNSSLQVLAGSSAANGSISLPSLAFTKHPDMGFYVDDSGAIYVTGASTQIAKFETNTNWTSGSIQPVNNSRVIGNYSTPFSSMFANNMYVPDGTGNVNNPLFGFVNNLGNAVKTGMFNGTNTLNFAVVGAERLLINATGTALTSVGASANSVTNALIIEWKPASGTPGAGFGVGIDIRGKSSTTNSRTMSNWSTTWVVATDASRTARIVGTVNDTAAREWIRGEASGSAAMIGFLGAAAVARQTTYTQTYSTTTSTVNPTATSAFTGIDNAQAGTVYAQLTDLNTLRTDMLQAMQLLNQLIDNDQAYGLAG